MKKILFLFSLLLFACSSNKDQRFCDCLTTSDELNAEASKYGSVALEDLTDKDVTTLKSLMHKKDSICAPFEVLGGEELLKKKEACK